MITKTKLATGTILASAGVFLAPAIHAQDESAPKYFDEIIVTAQKKAQGENVQDVPIALTAFDGKAIENLQIRDVNDLSYSVPNVSIDSSGTVKGLANFSIRGLGVTSSVPSLDPTVGTFVDGVYLGTNYGVILDTFDLEGIEVLRGPQGLLFGRNVIGGAVLVNTRDPSHEFSAKIKASLETGLQSSIAGSVTGSLVEDVLAGKLIAYYKNDEGYHTNAFNGNDNFGGDETFMVRGALALTPSENTEFKLKLETGSLEGDGAPNQNQEFLTGSHDVNIDNEGESDLTWSSAILETNIDVGFGDGTITNILGYREVDSLTNSDIDSRPVPVFDGIFRLVQDQFSAETRYAGTFFDDFWSVTAGVYYFEQDLLYRENRDIFNGVVVGTFGGEQETQTWALFASNEFAMTDTFSLIAGLRYTEEDKDVRTATFFPGGGPCQTTDPTDDTCTFNFTDSESWSNVSPKVGFKWELNDYAQFYGSWQNSFRSGGYNLRVSNATQSPGPVDEEKQSALEIGAKADWLDGRVRTNVALFRSEIDDLQRVVTQGDPNNVGAVIQTAANTADATIQGIEIEASAFLTDSLVLSGFVGLIDSEYTSVRDDLTGDGIVNADDLALQLPLLATSSWGVSLNYTHDMAAGEMSLQASYGFRTEVEATDNNLLGTQLPSNDILNASIGYTSEDERWSVALYGKNITDDVILQTRAIFPGITTGPGGFGTIQPIAKGRVIGVEGTLNF